ncbi:glycoside hydrolase family 15 protein [soil metagenome]
MPACADPPIGGHRLLSSGRSIALVTSDGVVDWWCAPEPDDPPLLWRLLDPRGAAACWDRARVSQPAEAPAGPSLCSTLSIDGARVSARDGLVELGGATCLVRLVRSLAVPVTITHRLELGGFDGDVAIPDAAGAWLGHERAHLLGAGATTTVDGSTLVTEVAAASDAWNGLVVALGVDPIPGLGEILDALDEADARAAEELRQARLPRHHPERVRAALAVLGAATYQPTGAVLAAATTSLPEAVGADRQFDYRYSWLRDAALASSVASLLGNHHGARRYLAFVRSTIGADGLPAAPLVDVRGRPSPEEREVPGVAGWGGSRPVRVGNAAAGQIQHDAYGLVVEAVSVHLQTGGSLDDTTWRMVRAIADHAATAERLPPHGMWELRQPRDLVSADIGRWIALDRAIRIGRLLRPRTARRQWRRARRDCRDRVFAALDEHGGLPQAYGDDYRPDASSLMASLFGLLGPRSEASRRLVDTTIADLEAGPFLYRYEPGSDDGFDGAEGTFLPMAWWAVAALAVTGRVDQARQRADELCAALPALLPEQIDPVDGTALGNVPLVWSHMELARAIYVLDAASLRRRWGPLGLGVWRIARYTTLRRSARRQTREERS